MKIEERLRRDLPALADALLDTRPGAAAPPAASPDEMTEIDFELDLRPKAEDNTMTTTRWLLAGIAAAVILLIVGVVALNDDDDQELDTVNTPEAPATPEAPTTTAVPTTTLAPEVLVAEQIRGLFDARNSALVVPVPDPDESLFAQFAVGEPLSNQLLDVQGLYDAGRAIRPGEEGLGDFLVGFVDAGTSEASAVACEVNDGVLYEVASGTVVNDDVVTREFEIDLELHDGVWKVSRIENTEQWDGVAGCALSPADYPF